MTIPQNDSDVLARFMDEFFPFEALVEAGFFTPNMVGDYQTQAGRVCEFFGYKTVYEYGAQETRCHITDGSTDGPFVTVISNVYA